MASVGRNAELISRAAVQLASPLGRNPPRSGSSTCSCLAAPVSPSAARRTERRDHDPPVRRAGLHHDEFTAADSLPCLAVETRAVHRRTRNVLILGSNGSGKTSLLNALIALLPAEFRVRGPSRP